MNVELEQHQINYTKKGHGNCIVFLHGFLENLTIWDDFAVELSEQYTIIQIDLPGHGKTDVFGKVHTMSIMAGAVNTVLNREGIRHAIVVGHSMGGYVAVEFAKQFPQKTVALCLFNSSVLADTPSKKDERTQVVKVLQRHANRFIEEAVPNLFTAENRIKLKSLIDELVIEAKEGPVEGMIACTLGMRDRPDSLDWLRTVNFPVHYIVGRQDPIISTDKYKDQLFANSNISAYLSSHSGHMGFIEDREGTFDSLKDFLTAVWEEN